MDDMIPNSVTKVCRKCGIPLFKVTRDKEYTQYRSFATRKDDDGNTYYLCIDCHEGKNKEMFENANRADKSVSEEET